MYTTLPSWSARCRTGSCAESGFAFRACRPPAIPAVSRSRFGGTASAPVKFGIRPAAPGNRATFAALMADQVSCRKAAFAARISAGPPGMLAVMA